LNTQPRFGPAGVPPTFKILKAKMYEVPGLLREEGLDAFEYQASRWGGVPQIQKVDAEKLGAEAKKHDVAMSVHGSYFINLSGKKDVVEASKERLIAAAMAADWMGASVVVFHTGFYGLLDKPYVLKTCIEELKEVSQTLQDMNIKVKLGPETMGRKSQVGSIDEVITICQEVENIQLVIDWGHMHARNMGTFRKYENLRDMAVKVEEKLGIETLRNMHCHYSKIEFGDQGEKRHRTLEEPGYGPNFEFLAKVIAEFHLNPTIICESPLLDIDAIRIRDIYKSIVQV
jgi:deoxyribonuclease IV